MKKSDVSYLIEKLKLRARKHKAIVDVSRVPIFERQYHAGAFYAILEVITMLEYEYEKTRRKPR